MGVGRRIGGRCMFILVRVGGEWWLCLMWKS